MKLGISLILSITLKSPSPRSHSRQRRNSECPQPFDDASESLFSWLSALCRFHFGVSILCVGAFVAVLFGLLWFRSHPFFNEVSHFCVSWWPCSISSQTFFQFRCMTRRFLSLLAVSCALRSRSTFFVAWQRDDSQDVSDTLNTWNVSLFLVIDSRGRPLVTRVSDHDAWTRAQLSLDSGFVVQSLNSWRTLCPERKFLFFCPNFFTKQVKTVFLRSDVALTVTFNFPLFVVTVSLYNMLTASRQRWKVIGVPGLVDSSFEVQSLHSEKVPLENVESVSRSPKEV